MREHRPTYVLEKVRRLTALVFELTAQDLPDRPDTKIRNEAMAVGDLVKSVLAKWDGDSQWSEEPK